TPLPDSIFHRNIRRRELRHPTSISGVVSCKSFLSSSLIYPAHPFSPIKNLAKRWWQRGEKPAKTADVTGEVSGHREMRRCLEQVLRPHIRSRRDPLRVKHVGLLIEFCWVCSIHRGDSAKIL
ncbi:hypothetical protein Prudu_022850, partial [Prunus dulcis]